MHRNKAFSWPWLVQNSFLQEDTFLSTKFSRAFIKVITVRSKLCSVRVQGRGERSAEIHAKVEIFKPGCDRPSSNKLKCASFFERKNYSSSRRTLLLWFLIASFFDISFSIDTFVFVESKLIGTWFFNSLSKWRTFTYEFSFWGANISW